MEKIELRTLAKEWIPAVEAFNARLRARDAGGPIFPTSCGDQSPGGFERELIIATEGDAVRGGYILKLQDFRFPSGKHRALGAFQLPLSEGIIDKRYTLVGLHLLFDATRRHPLLYTLGIGGFEEPFARMLIAAGWRLDPVAFFFRIVRPTTFLRNIVYLRSSRLRRLLFDLAAALRLASLPIRALHVLRDRHRRRAVDYRREERFGDWSDELWREASSQHALVGVRAAAVLNVLYPPGEERFVRLRVRDRGSTVGWAVVMNNPWTDHRHFGAMRLGSLVDCLALRGYEGRVGHAATHYLEENGADLIVSNQNHQAWRAALRECGYLEGPSNFLLAASPALVDAVAPWDKRRQLVHMNRGDGDGPIHL
ncbi:MAG: hypothetical protein GY856_51735 [bacterium]|nr:hypothetical protein [bacterium]